VGSFASKEQAARIVKNLPLFERQGGLRTALMQAVISGILFGWAPLQMIAVDGLRRSSYKERLIALYPNACFRARLTVDTYSFRRLKPCSDYSCHSESNSGSLLMSIHNAAAHPRQSSAAEPTQKENPMIPLA